jgi:hypothetical protein
LRLRLPRHRMARSTRSRGEPGGGRRCRCSRAGAREIVEEAQAIGECSPRRGGAGTKPATETEAGARVSRGCTCVRGHASWCRGTGGGDRGGASPASSGGGYGRRWPESRGRRAHRTELVSCACFLLFLTCLVCLFRERVLRGA